MTWYPIKQFIVDSNTQSNTNYKVMPKAISVSVSENDRAPSDGNVDPSAVSIQEICLAMFSMDLLMKFLEREYSRENLLFIVEVTLLQRAMYEHIEHNQRQYAQQNI